MSFFSIVVFFVFEWHKINLKVLLYSVHKINILISRMIGILNLLS